MGPTSRGERPPGATSSSLPRVTSHPPPILTPSSDPHGRNSIISATEIVSYETSKRFFLDNLPMRDDWRTHLAAGCTAGFAATVLGSPADVLGTKAMQKHGRYAGLTATQIARKMVRRHKFRAHLIRERKRSELEADILPSPPPPPQLQLRNEGVLSFYKGFWWVPRLSRHPWLPR